MNLLRQHMNLRFLDLYLSPDCRPVAGVGLDFCFWQARVRSRHGLRHPEVARELPDL